MYLRKRVYTMIGILLVVSLLAVGCGKKEEAAAEIKKIPVTTVTVTKGNLEKSIPLGGLLQPIENVTLTAQNPGAKIAHIPVQVGDMVSTGTPLVIFDSRDIDIQLNQTALDYERNKQLFEAGALSKAQLEQTANTLENLKLQKEHLLLTSPVNGIVASVSGVEGQLAGAGSLVNIVNISKLKLEVQVGEVHIAKIERGREMTVEIPASEGKQTKGIVTTIAPHMDVKTKAYPVTLEIDNQDNLIRGGMYGEVQLLIDRKEDILIIPQFAILDQEQKKIVYVVESDQAVKKEIKAGLTIDDKAEVTEGLKEGEILIVEGQYGIKDGSPVSSTVKEGQK